MRMEQPHLKLKLSYSHSLALSTSTKTRDRPPAGLVIGMLEPNGSLGQRLLRVASDWRPPVAGWQVLSAQADCVRVRSKAPNWNIRE